MVVLPYFLGLNAVFFLITLFIFTIEHDMLYNICLSCEGRSNSSGKDIFRPASPWIKYF